MIRLTPHDSSVMTALAQFTGVPPERKRALLDALESTEAREVGAALLDRQVYHQAPPRIRDTVDYFLRWVENNKRLGREREVRRRKSRA